eukprot:5963730-Pyramimonas_sp.AAC.1
MAKPGPDGGRRAILRGLQRATGSIRLWRAWPSHSAPAECFKMALRPGSINKRSYRKDGLRR